MTQASCSTGDPLDGLSVSMCTGSATGLALWVEHAARLPRPWTGVELTVHDSATDPGAAMHDVAMIHPDLLIGPYGSRTMLSAAHVTDRVTWNHRGATS